jgi:hypothetical protein
VISWPAQPDRSSTSCDEPLNFNGEFLKRKERYERNVHRKEFNINSIARNLNVHSLMSSVFCSRGNAVMVRWVNNAMAFAMFFAFLAVFAVKLR